jgi:shikimate kinase
MKHLILIGYKSVGKSAIGRVLANEARMNFIDLDEELEKIYKEKHGIASNCRQIMLKIGQEAFRELEHQALKVALSSPSHTVISLGGGTPLRLDNKTLIKSHMIVQITAPKNIVFERIMINGKPAFFPEDEHPLISFNRTWKDRTMIYDALTNIKVDNSGSLNEAVRIIKEKIN